jgi:DNA polymerase phi
MELYKELASDEEARRIKAAEELVRKVVDGHKSGNADNGAELTYALTRLVKGLASGRESARLGFSIALTEVWSPVIILNLATS